MLDHLEAIAKHAATITEHAIGGAVGGASAIAHGAAEIAENAVKSTMAAGGELAGHGLAIAGSVGNISQEVADLAAQGVGESINTAAGMAEAIGRISVAATMMAGGAASGAIHGATSITGDALKVAADAAKIAADAAGGVTKGAANIVGGAAAISIEAAKITGGAAEEHAAIISEMAARMAAEAASGVIDGGVAATEAIAREAGTVAGEAVKLAGEAGSSAAGSAAVIAGEAAKILAEAAKLPGGAGDVVAENVASTASHLAVIGDIINAGKFVVTTTGSTIFRHVTDSDVVLETASRVLRDGSDNTTRNLVNVAISRGLALISPEDLLNQVTGVFQRVKDDGTIRNLIFAITRRTFSAFGPHLGQLPAIYKGIFSNTVNWETLQIILKNRATLARFLIDLVEPAKGFALDNSTNGISRPDKEECQNYNEFNMNDPMNKHAVICQLQRAAKSVVAVLEKDERAGELEESSLERFDMKTTLETDSGGDLGSSELGDKHDERWFFVNGIAGEPYWVRMACRKLEFKFKRKVQGVFNRSDGILWDLVECTGERDISGGHDSGLIEKTQSSREAKEKLKAQLETVLWPESGEGKADLPKVVVIAHSQGCLVLRLVLEEFARRGKPEMENMKKRLHVFTFGNPSLNWGVSEHCAHTEHFANRTDFVARLGFFNGSDGYEGQLNFINENWTGHLFGSQYSLDPGDYGTTGGDSNLLRCEDGGAIDR